MRLNFMAASALVGIVILFCANPIDSEEIGKTFYKSNLGKDEPKGKSNYINVSNNYMIKRSLDSDILYDISRPLIDKKYDQARLLLDKKAAKPLDLKFAISSFPSSLDYSQYVTMTVTQDGWGGCIGRSIIHCLNMLKEMEHPYTPDLSFRYMDIRQYQPDISKHGTDNTKTLLESQGICPEASLPSDYDKSAPEITAELNKEASIYKILTYSEPQMATVENLKSLLVLYGPIIGGGAFPLVTDNYVDSVSGTIGSDGRIQFTRDRPGKLTQIYEGMVNENGLDMDGTFTGTGSSKTFDWNARQLKSSIVKKISGGSDAIDLSGRWILLAAGSSLFLDLSQDGDSLSGTISCAALEDNVYKDCEGHYTTIVGYNDASKSFKCLNSWGDTWGLNRNGYFDLPYEEVSTNLDSGVRYLLNGESDRSSTEHAYTARISVTACKRNNILIKVGAEGMESKTVWDTPCQTNCEDDSETICIDVPLPSYASSFWPPKENQLYAEIQNNCPNSARVNEVTMARLIHNPHCVSIGRFRTEIYRAEILPRVPAGETVKIYINGDNQGLGNLLEKNEWFDLEIEPDWIKKTVDPKIIDYYRVLNGSLTKTTFHIEKPGADREILIYKKLLQPCLNLPPDWEVVGSTTTRSDGSFTFEPSEKDGTYAAAIVDSNGITLASSREVLLHSNDVPPGFNFKKPLMKKPDKKIRIDPVDEMNLKRGYAEKKVMTGHS
jgi:hypothetical protein